MFGLKVVNEKLNQVLKNQEVIINMLTTFIEIVESKQLSVDDRKKKMESYTENILGIMSASGAPPEMIGKFKILLGGLT